MRSANKPQFLLFLSLFNSVLGLSILFPILAPLGRQLGLTEVQVGWLSTGYALMQFIASPLWGRKSERIGRRPVLLTGIFGFGIGFGAFGLVAQVGLHGGLSGAPLFIALLATRLLGGLLSSATMPTAQAYIADITERNERTAGMALVGAAFGLGIVFGPGIGAALSHFGLLVPVYASAAVALLNGLFVWRQLPEPARRAHLAEFVPSAAVLTRVWPVLGVGFAVTLASVSMEQTVAFLFQDVLHLDGEHAARTVGAALVCYGVSAVICQGFIVRRMRWSPLKLLLLGIPLSALGLLGLVISTRFLGLTVALAIQGFGQGLVMPGIAAALSLAVNEGEQGEVAGLNSASQALGRTLGPILGTMMYGFYPRLPYALSVALMALVLLAVVANPKVRRRVSLGAQG
jgi:MFS transporter, DHA1 family, tetracycline resistance protein